MLDYDFMRTAFAAGGVVAVVAGAVGFFLVLRNLTFAGHALSHVGFAGATGAVLVGVGPLWGLLAFTLGAAVAMGLLGEQLRNRDVGVGIVLALALGLGVLFLYFYTTSASEATAILFGNVLGVAASTLRSLVGLSLIALVALAVISRPLLFATLEPELAEAKGVSLRLLSVLFLGIVAIAVAEAAQVVGSLDGLRVDGRSGSGSAAPRPPPLLGIGARRRPRRGRDLGRHRSRLCHRLAYDLLDRAFKLQRLLPQPSRSRLCTARTRRSCSLDHMSVV